MSKLGLGTVAAAIIPASGTAMVTAPSIQTTELQDIQIKNQDASLSRAVSISADGTVSLHGVSTNRLFSNKSLKTNAMLADNGTCNSAGHCSNPHVA